jgi:hypothetical protein
MRDDNKWGVDEEATRKAASAEFLRWIDERDKAKHEAEAAEIQNGIDERAKIGYGHPPVNRRFQKGVSGNPCGRPRKPERANSARQFDTDVLRAANEKVVTAFKNGKKTRATMRETILKQINTLAANGSLPHAKFALELQRIAVGNGMVSNRRLHNVLEDMEQEA